MTPGRSLEPEGSWARLGRHVKTRGAPRSMVETFEVTPRSHASSLSRRVRRTGERLLRVTHSNLRCRRTSHHCEPLAPDSRELSRSNQSRLDATRRSCLYQTSLHCFAHIGSTTNRASMGFYAPTASRNKSSDQRRSSTSGCAAPSDFLSLVTRYSALALLALFHARSAHGVEALRGFPLPVAAPDSRRALPLQPYATFDIQGRRIGAAPKNDTSTSPERTTPPHRSEERRLGIAPNHSPDSLRGVRRISDPHEGRVALGFLHLEGPFTAKWCYPTSAGRASLSL
jgi:hypothetical protein